MIRAALLLASVPAALQGGGELLRAPQPLEAKLVLEPTEAEVGQPMRWTVEVAHPAGSSVVLPELELDDSWSVLDAGRPRTRSIDPSWSVTSRTFTVVSLEPGERELPALVAAVSGQAEPIDIEAPAAGVRIHSVLDPGEDAPRPLRGFRELAAPEEGFSLDWILPSALSFTLLAALVSLWMWRRGKRSQGSAPPSPFDQLEETAARLESDPPNGLEELRALHYDLARFVRAAADERLGRPRPALTDEEWMAATEAETTLAPGQRELIAQALTRCKAGKYARTAPTAWAVRETLIATREAARSLAERGNPEPERASARPQEVRR